ncbi:DUF5007 domain-containing protein [Mucilaginibacter sp. SG564]|uniref:DUF5007 domain-containing protein n=1 Tax=unclassified Mucilaginibacter TaxID=2617802 RepID=UPI001552A3C6|nr:DUF5007 domain-containing protein [Mucilaginibacter sp. SG564]NOW97171.1 hypothetical protein [Mucilaginibacter sp. SG564]
MKKYIKLLNLVLFAVAGILSCKKTAPGFLSDNVRYSADPLVVNQGVFLISNGIIPDNSTPPFKITLLNVRNMTTGAREETFFKEYDVPVWKTAYDPITDTTLDLINKKRAFEKKVPFSVLEKSGQFLFTQATENVPPGQYLIDIKIENPHGTKTYMGVCKVILNPIVQYEYVNTPYFIALPANSETGIRFAYDDQWIDADKGQSTTITLNIKRVAASPNQIVLKVLDKNGAVFPGAALERRPSGNSFLKTLSTFAYKTTVTDTAVLYDYAQTRFPDVYWDSQSNGLNCYYRIYDKYIASIDTADSKNWNPPGQIPYGTWNKQPVKLNIRFNTKINQPGKYIYELRLKATKK